MDILNKKWEWILGFCFNRREQRSIKKYTKVWDEIKYLIKTINGGKSSEYGRNFMKNKFNSDDDLPFNKPLKVHAMTVIIRSVLKKMENIIHKSF